MKRSSRSGLWLAGLIGAASLALTPSAQTPTPTPQAAIEGVIAAGAKVELVKGGFMDADAAVPTPDGGLYFTDIRANRIYKVERNGAITVWREHPGGANGLFPASDGRLLVAERDGKRMVAIAPNGSIEVLVMEFRGRPLRAPGNLLMDAKGGIYFTDPGRATPEGSYVLYCRPGGEVILIDNEFIFPNGLALSLDGKMLYAVDLNAEHVYAFEIQADGSATNRHRFATLEGYTQPATALPRSGADGMAIDWRGRLYVTSDTGIQVVSPTGQYLGTIQVPTKARSIAFGGPGRRTLYIVSATDLYWVPLLSEGPPVRPE